MNKVEIELLTFLLAYHWPRIFKWGSAKFDDKMPQPSINGIMIAMELLTQIDEIEEGFCAFLSALARPIEGRKKMVKEMWSDSHRKQTIGFIKIIINKSLASFYANDALSASEKYEIKNNYMTLKDESKNLDLGNYEVFQVYAYKVNAAFTKMEEMNKFAGARPKD